MKRLFLFVSALVLTGCDTLKIFQDNTPKTQAEAGSVFVSAQHPRLWASIANDLKPNFAVKSADELLALVLPTTMSDNYSNRSGFSAGLNLGLQQTAVTKSDSTTIAKDLVTGNVTDADQIVTRERTVTPGGVTAVDTTLELDPAKYEAFTGGRNMAWVYDEAAGLYQKIKLLNAYLSGQVAAEGEIPFLMRAQVTVMPYARREAIDVYTRLWVQLEDNCNTPHNRSIDRRCDRAAPGGPRQIDPIHVRLLPLVIMDTHEVSASKRLAQQLLQLDTNISAITGGTGVGAGAGYLRDQLREAAGSDMNALITVAQTSEKELMIRFGAAQSPTSGYEMQNRTYDITFLALVPEAVLSAARAPMLSVTEDSSFRNALTGAQLPYVTDGYLSKLRGRIRSQLESLGADEDPNTKTLKADVDKQLEDGNTQLALDRVARAGTKFNPVYNQILAHADAVEPSIATVPVPDWRTVLPPTQAATMIDQPNAGAVVQVAGSRALYAGDEVQAFLITKSKDALPTENDVKRALSGGASPGEADITGILVARNLSVDASGMVTMNFPSPAALGRANASMHHYVVLTRRPFGVMDKSELRTSSAASYTFTYSDLGIYPVLRNNEMSKASEEQAGFTATIWDGALTLDGARPNAPITLTLSVDRGKSPNTVITGYKISVTGAVLDSAKSVGVAATVVVIPSENSMTITSDGAYALDLRGMKAGEKSVKIKVTPLKAAIVAGGPQTPIAERAADKTVDVVVATLPKPQ